MRDLRLLGFQVVQFAKVPYFVQTLITVTLTAVLLQWLLGNAFGTVSGADQLVWMRAGAVGSWSLTCTAAGILGFQRYQGVLASLVFSPVGAIRSLFPVIISCVVFGMLAFPLALGFAALLGFPVGFGNGWLAAVAITMFFCGSALLALCIALFFMLTPNALTYEALVTLPVVLLAGIFGYPEATKPVLEPLGTLIPIGTPIRLLEAAILERDLATAEVLPILIAWGVGVIVCGVALTLLTRVVLRRVSRDGSLEVQ